MSLPFSEISARMNILVVSKIPDLHLVRCKFKNTEIAAESPERVELQLEDGNRIQIFQRGPLTDLWFDCPPDKSISDVYCRLGSAISMLVVDVFTYLLNSIDGFELCPAEYVEGDGYDLSEMCEFLQNGCQENISTLQRFLERVKAKKRWKVVKCLGRISCCYQEFVKEYYAPPEGSGYLKAKCDFLDLMNSRFRAE